MSRRAECLAGEWQSVPVAQAVMSHVAVKGWNLGLHVFSKNSQELQNKRASPSSIMQVVVE